jgi:hypothetical protein
MLKNFVKISRITLSFILLSLSISFVQAQDNCPTIVQDALSVMDTACSAVERNQACYGNGQIEVLAQPDFTLSAFETPGDQIEVAGIQTMTLYPLDETTSTWGVSLMQVQANLPDTVPGQNVTVLLFGDTEITSASQTLDAFYFRGGVGEAGCAQAPNGIMIQTPEGAGMIDLTINDVQVSLGSTAYVTAEVEDFLTFNLLEGEAEVTADGETQVVAGGEFVQVPMDENLSATGAPSEAEAINFTLLPVLPIQLLPQDISEDAPELNVANDDDSVVPSGEVIIPATGNWAYTLDEFATSADCPPGLDGIIRANLPVNETSFVDFGGQAIDLAALLAGNEGLAVTYTNPANNVYQASFSEDGGTFFYELSVISESEITGFMEIGFDADGISCTMTMDFSVTLSE